MNYDEIYSDLVKVTSREDMYKFLNMHYNNGVYCELGVFYSHNLKNILKECNPKLIYAVDLWESVSDVKITDSVSQNKFNEMYNIILEVKKQYPAVKIIRDYTSNASKLVSDNSLDVIYIDANHSYEGVKEDLENWTSKVKKGGIISGHDYFKHSSAYKFGVVEAVDEFKLKYDVKYFHHTPEPYAPSWFIIKDF